MHALYQQKELQKETVLVEGIKSVMPQDTKERWMAQMRQQETHGHAPPNQEKAENKK